MNKAFLKDSALDDSFKIKLATLLLTKAKAQSDCGSLQPHCNIWVNDVLGGHNMYKQHSIGRDCQSPLLVRYPKCHSYKGLPLLHSKLFVLSKIVSNRPINNSIQTDIRFVVA
jgi:hypothetical protein